MPAPLHCIAARGCCLGLTLARLWSITAAGFGWSANKQKCGNFKNKVCNAGSLPAASAAGGGADTACRRGWSGRFCDRCAAGFVGDMCDRQADGHSPDRRWARYRDKHEAAIDGYMECAGISCYNSTLAADLAPFAEAGGISRQSFERAREHNAHLGRMNHYQIIDGKLYRSPQCRSFSDRMSFHPRCEGIPTARLRATPCLAPPDSPAFLPWKRVRDAACW